MYARCQEQPPCLHSSNLASHCSIAVAGEDDGARKRLSQPAGAMEFSYSEKAQLLGGDFARRIKRAGIVNFSYLVITKSEDLSEDFVGMFPEQRRA
jgi:hypothetical protein